MEALSSEVQHRLETNLPPVYKVCGHLSSRSGCVKEQWPTSKATAKDAPFCRVSKYQPVTKNKKNTANVKTKLFTFINFFKLQLYQLLIAVLAVYQLLVCSDIHSCLWNVCVKEAYTTTPRRP